MNEKITTSAEEWKDAIFDSAPVIPKHIDYKFNEGNLMAEIHEYINATYGEHYSKSKFQATEFIIDAGHGDGFCIGNVMKYAQRYGKKGGYNRADLLKIIHYAIIELHVHDREGR